MTAPSPLTASSAVPSFSLTVNGSAVDAAFAITAMEVEFALNRIPAAQITIAEPSDGEGSVASASTFSPGAVVQISAGYDGNNTPIFSGVIVKIAAQQRGGSGASCIVSCRDRAVVMTRGRRSARHVAADESALWSALLSRHGLEAEIASLAGGRAELTQFAATDWDFLLTRAEANGCVVAIRDGRVAIAPPRFDTAPVLGVTLGVDLLAFELEEDARTQFASATASAWDPAAQRLVAGEAVAKNLNTFGSDRTTTLACALGSPAEESATSATLPEDGLRTWAAARLLKSELARIRGTLRFAGSALVHPGETMTVSGIGPRFDGNACVSGVRHEIRDGNWITTATIGLDPDWFAARPDVSTPLAGAMLPGATGLHIGTVKQVHDDPDGNFRVLVHIASIDAGGDYVWARWTAPYATGNAGSFALPEIGDEVVVGFLESDPRFPVIVGSLFSSSRPPPFTPDERGALKALVTRNQLKIVCDDVKRTITLCTPAGNTLVLNDDTKGVTLADENGNVLRFGTDGITLKSVANLTLVAAQNVAVTAEGGGVRLAGTTEAAMTAPNVTLKADAQLKAEGDASAALVSSGETIVRGTMVMIN